MTKAKTCVQNAAVYHDDGQSREIMRLRRVRLPFRPRQGSKHQHNRIIKINNNNNPV
jgi:hypothetical protein